MRSSSFLAVHQGLFGPSLRSDLAGCIAQKGAICTSQNLELLENPDGPAAFA
jgi:hypothetical protein